MTKPVQQNTNLAEQFKSLAATWISPVLMALIGFFLSQTYSRLQDSEKLVREIEKNQIRVMEKVARIEEDLEWLESENIQIRKKIDELTVQQTQTLKRK